MTRYLFLGTVCMFTLHPRLAEDTLPLGDFPLSTCRLMNDMHYPWLVLVPDRKSVV